MNTNQNETTENTVAATPKAKAPRIRKPAVVAEKSKTDLARTIFNKNYRKGRKLNRAKILEQFVKDAGLTMKGASTYFQRFKGEKGLIGKAA